MVSCKLSPKSILGFFVLKYICAIDAYIFCGSLWSILFYGVLYIFVNLYAWVLGFSVFQWDFFPKLSSFGQFVMKLSSDPHLKHVFGFQPLRSVRLLLELNKLKGYFIWPLCFSVSKRFFRLGVFFKRQHLTHMVNNIWVDYWQMSQDTTQTKILLDPDGLVRVRKDQMTSTIFVYMIVLS